MGYWMDCDTTDIERAQRIRAELEAEMAKDLEESAEVRRAYGWPPLDPAGPEDLVGSMAPEKAAIILQEEPGGSPLMVAATDWLGIEQDVEDTPTPEWTLDLPF